MSSLPIQTSPSYSIAQFSEYCPLKKRRVAVSRIQQHIPSYIQTFCDAWKSSHRSSEEKSRKVIVILNSLNEIIEKHSPSELEALLKQYKIPEDLSQKALFFYKEGLALSSWNEVAEQLKPHIITLMEEGRGVKLIQQAEECKNNPNKERIEQLLSHINSALDLYLYTDPSYQDRLNALYSKQLRIQKIYAQFCHSQPQREQLYRLQNELLEIFSKYTTVDRLYTP